MSPEDFSNMGRALLSKGWQTRLSGMLEVDGSTIRRWVGSGMAIPPTASAFLSMMADRQETRGALTYARQKPGRAVQVDAPDVVVQFEKLARPCIFPGTPDPKRMPSIVALPSDDRPAIALRSDQADRIETAGLSFILTRHPDPYHLAGYRAAAIVDDHRTTAVRYGDHYYSLLAHEDAGPPMILQEIATHQAVVRRIWSAVSDPSRILHADMR